MPPFVKCKFSFVYLQLIFEGTAGSSYAGDIAIDDVLIVDATCPKEGIEKFLLHFFFMFELFSEVTYHIFVVPNLVFYCNLLFNTF